MNRSRIDYSFTLLQRLDPCAFSCMQPEDLAISHKFFRVKLVCM